MLEPAFQIGKAATLTAMMVASLAMGTTETWARSSKRAAWNNAACIQQLRMKLLRLSLWMLLEKK